MTKFELFEALERMVKTAKEVVDKIAEIEWTTAKALGVAGNLLSIIAAVKALIQKLISFLLGMIERLLHDVKLAQIMDDVGNYLTEVLVTDVAGIQNGFLPELAGRNDQHWRGSGAKAYTRCTDRQGQACAELTTAYQSVAKALHDAYGGCLVFAGAVLVAGATLVKTVVSALIALLPPTTGIGAALIAAGASIFKAMIFAASALAAAWFVKLGPELRKAEDGIDKAVLNNGQTVFYHGKWPTPDLSPEK